MNQSLIFDGVAMRARRDAWYAFVRRQAGAMFEADGRYAPATRADLRIAYWVYPALITGETDAERELANRVCGAGASWEAFDVFCTSAIALNLTRHHRQMTAALVRRSEDHLARFLVAAEGRQPCAAANDYVFHGYNDNMPAMSTRALILGGEWLERPAVVDRGLFNLEGLAAHFERRGLLSEYTSGTYTPITLTALMDVAELARTPEARELAAASARRVMLDLLGHWHPELGLLAGAMSRAYTTDLTATFTNVNALFWYWSGHRLCLDPIAVLGGDDYDGPMAHARNRAWNIAGITELVGPDYADLPPSLVDWARASRTYPHEIHATSDSGQQGVLGGVKEIQTRAFHQPAYFLGTASETWFGQAGQQPTLYGGLGTSQPLRDWRDRVTFWHRTVAGTLDQGDPEPVRAGAPHAMATAEATLPPASGEVSHVTDVGVYHVLQQRGTALVLGMLGVGLLDQEVDRLKLSILFQTHWRQPAELVEQEGWVFLRFGAVYVGVRASGMVGQQRATPRVVDRLHYLRVELPLLDGAATKVTPEFREWCDYGYVLEVASREECGSFAKFCAACRACRWEFYHGFYRTSRYQGRHGELQIIDSVAAGTARFLALDGHVEPRTRLVATGLDPQLAQLLPDGRRVRQRRLFDRPDFIGSPFYQWPAHVLETGE